MSYQNTKLAILAVLSLAAVAPAHAQPPALFHQEHILVGDLDLNSESGVKALRTRPRAGRATGVPERARVARGAHERA